MNSGGGDCLAFSPNALILEQGRGWRGTAPHQSPHPRCRRRPPLCPQRGLGFPPRRAGSDACKRRRDASKCQTASCRCQLFMARDIYQREAIKSPEAGISLGAQVDGSKMFMSEVCCSMHWAESRHQNLPAWGEHLTRVVCLTLSALLSIWH